MSKLIRIDISHGDDRQSAVVPVPDDVSNEEILESVKRHVAEVWGSAYKPRLHGPLHPGGDPRVRA